MKVVDKFVSLKLFIIFVEQTQNKHKMVWYVRNRDGGEYCFTVKPIYNEYLGVWIAIENGKEARAVQVENGTLDLLSDSKVDFLEVHTFVK